MDTRGPISLPRRHRYPTESTAGNIAYTVNPGRLDVLFNRLIVKFSSTERKLGLPALAMEKGWDYAKVLEEGSKKYPNSPYIITCSGYEYVVFPSSSFEEIKRLNASRASMVDWFTTVFWQGWHFLGTDNSSPYHTFGIDLVRALPSRVWMRQENARAAFYTVLGSPVTPKELKEVSFGRLYKS